MTARRSAPRPDTVTIVGEDTTKHAGAGMLPSYTLGPGVNDKELAIHAHPADSGHDLLAASLGRTHVLTPTPDLPAAQRCLTSPVERGGIR